MVGLTLTHYRVLRRVGGGGMGEVYEAEDLRLGRHVALKVLPPSLSSDRPSVERLRREARAASSLNHPHICTIHDIGEHDGQQFIVMELLEGQTLRELVAAGPIDVPMLLEIAVQVTDALDAAHAAGIVHRDVKPANIFLTSRQAGRVRDGAWVKLLDFGVAKATAGMRSSTAALADAQMPTAAADEPLTGPATALGTISYMSPEQALGEELDGRSDLFSFGVVLYEMATGRVPFAGRTSASIFNAILNGTPAPVTELNPRAPRELERVIEKALEKDRALRHQSAGDLRADLLRVQRGSGVVANAPAAGGAAQRGWRWTLGLAVAAVAVLAVVIALVVMSRRAPALTDRDVILLADWINTTGDATFDDALKPALAAHLQQSPFLSILSQERVRSALRFMRRSPDERLTPPVARDLCQREGVKAMLAGSIAAVGTVYSIALEATNCATGESLAAEVVEATSKEDVLAAVGRAAAGMRRRLGESLASIQEHEPPAAKATTRSLEAWKAFSLGEAERLRGREAEAIPLYRRATELDPSFALAYARMGTIFANEGEYAQAIDALKKAFELRDHASDAERFYILSHYHGEVTGDLDRYLQTLELWKQTYPRATTPRVNIAYPYSAFMARFQDAIEEMRPALAEDPRTLYGAQRMVEAYRGLNRLEEGREVVERLIADGWAGESERGHLFEIAFMQRDRATVARQLEWAKDRPDVAGRWQARAAAFSGKWREASRFWEMASGDARAAGREAHARQTALWSMQAALVGHVRQARALIDAWTPPASPPPDLFPQCLALALAGDRRKAEAIAAAVSKQFPQATIHHRVTVPLVRAIIALEDRRPEQAIESLEVTRRFDAGPDFFLLPVYFRGQAYLQTARPKEAAAEFERIVAYEAPRYLTLAWPLARLGLARARAASGDIAASRAAYQEFLALWKDADEDLPVLRAARAEYAALAR